MSEVEKVKHGKDGYRVPRHVVGLDGGGDIIMRPSIEVFQMEAERDRLREDDAKWRKLNETNQINKRFLDNRLTEAERLLDCDDIFVSAEQQMAWKAERDAFLNQKEGS